MKTLDHIPQQQTIMATPHVPGDHSTDLVPLTYEREAYNAIPHVETRDGHASVYYTRLEHHDDKLNAEDARRINDNYDIELNFGVHGSVERSVLAKPTQREYEAAKEVVDGLEPGDTLFVEGYGFRYQPPSPDQDKAFARLQKDFISMLSAVGANLPPSVLSQLSASRADSAEARRAQYAISAWGYAMDLALEKGVNVVYADADAFMGEKFDGVTSGRSILDLFDSGDPESLRLAERLQAVRDKQTRNLVKDWALANLPPAGQAPNVHGRKRKLAVLFGSYHSESLQDAFKQLHIDTVVNQMPESTLEQRATEQFSVMVGNMLGSMALGLLMGSGRVVTGDDYPLPRARPAHPADQAGKHIRERLTRQRAERFRDIGQARRNFGGIRGNFPKPPEADE